MTGFLYTVWLCIAYGLLGLWTAKFIVSIPSIHVSAGVMARRGIHGFWYYYPRLFVIIAIQTVLELFTLLSCERSTFFKVYRKYDVIKNTLIGIRQASH